jgi:hypothetical protein
MFSRTKLILIVAALAFVAQFSGRGAENVRITDVPDYDWYAGCFGSASGNLMGFWDRAGFPNMYTGPTAGGVAPMDAGGENIGIRSLWASRAGFDGRPADKPGHIDDYWNFYVDESSMSYESSQPDPYVTAGRPEHAPDCTGDFMGASQNKWTNMNDECDGNVDAFSFNWWDHSGARRFNFTPPTQNGLEVRDIQSGFRKFAEYRGYQADSFSQLVDFYAATPAGTGFTFEDLKAEINAGYPMMLFLQSSGFNRPFQFMAHGNPVVHGMIATGYVTLDDGSRYVRYRTSWGEGDHLHRWTADPWEIQELSLRGIIGFHPKPKITTIKKGAEGVSVKWDGPAATLVDDFAGTTLPAHWYVLERATSLNAMDFTTVTQASTNHEALVDSGSSSNAFYRVKLLDRAQIPPPPN